jgi:plasmid stability protein
VAQLVVRNLEEDVKARLQRRANRHGQSMEEEVRDILRNAVRTEQGAGVPLGSRIRDRFAGFGLDDEISTMRGQRVRTPAFAKR